MAATHIRTVGCIVVLPEWHADAWKRSSRFRRFEGAFAMAYSGVVEPEQLAVLTAVVETYCRENGIDPTGNEREEVARLVMKLFCQGIATAEELRTVLLGPIARALAQPSIGLALQDLKAVGRARRRRCGEECNGPPPL
jgi:hypothetical protein